MKPSARIQANIDILESAHAARVPMDARIGDYMRARRYIGSKDRAAVAERAYDMMRAKARISWWIAKAGIEDDARNRVLVWLILGEGCDKKRLKDLFDGSKYSPDSLMDREFKDIESLFGARLDHKDMPLYVRVECPEEYRDKLLDYFGDDFEVEMQAMLSPATLDLRVNLFLADKAKVLESFKKDNVVVAETPYSPWGFRCEKKIFLSKTKAFQKGWVEIQDEGSQMIAYLCGARPGMQVLDFCAGAGGKTLALGSAMMRKGRIVAMDNDARRLNKGKQRYKKAWLSDIIEVRCLDDDKQRKWLKRQKGKFDIVLTDVPCSGTGTWRRNPDMRWVMYGPSLEELVSVQAEILAKASSAVKPGGRLVYATCSLLKEENEAQIEAFLAAHPDFSVEALEEARGLGSPYMRLTPHRHNTDGFFAAVLVRSGDV